MIMLLTKETIENCPYTSIVLLPPQQQHKATFYVISICECGTATVDYFASDDKSFITTTMKPNDAVIIRPFDNHVFHNNDDPYSHRDIYVDDSLMKECCDFLDPNLYQELLNEEYSPSFEISGSYLVSLAETLSQLMGKEKNKERDLLHRGVIISLLTRYYENKIKKTVYPGWINQLLRDINQEDFIVKTIDEMVKTTNYSHGYVNREFKKYLKCSLKSYVIKTKLSFAFSLLSTTDIPLDEIVDRLGFTTISNFISVFKKHYGITPAKFRKNQRVSIETDSYTEWGKHLGDKGDWYLR